MLLHVLLQVLNGMAITLNGSPAERAVALARLESLPQVICIAIPACGPLQQRNSTLKTIVMSSDAY